MENSAEQIIDQILVMDAQDGRARAFEMLVSRWQKRLWRHAYNMTGRSDAAWDITQESWLSIVDVKLAQLTAMFAALIVAKLIPDIMNINIWWFVVLFVLCAIRPFYVFWFGK